MARVTNVPFEMNSAVAGIEVSSATGSPAISTSVKHSGERSMQITSLVSGTAKGVIVQHGNAASTGRTYFRIWYRVDTYPSAENTIIELNDTSAFTTPIVYITIDSSGLLRLYDEDGVIGSPSSALSTATWYYIEVMYDGTGTAGTHDAEALLNGSSFAASTTRSLSAGIIGICLGGNLLLEAQTTGNWYFDDLAINDPNGTLQVSWVGSSEFLVLAPDSAGDNTAWTPSTGANYACVDEYQPPNDATDDVQEGTLNDVDDYNLAATTAVIDADDVVNCVAVNFRNTLTSSADGDPAFVVRIKASASGTVEESAAITKNNTIWNTNNQGSIVGNQALILYDLPGASTTAWLKADLDTAQIGVRCSTGDTDFVRVTAEWLYVDFVHATSGVTISLIAAALAASGQVLTVVEGAVTKQLTNATVTASGQQITVSAPPPAITINLTSAALTAAGQALTVVKGAVTKLLSNAVITAQGQALTVVKGAVTKLLSAAGVIAQGQAITISAPSGTVVNLGAAVLAAGGQALTVVKGAVTKALSNAAIVAQGQALTVVKGAVTKALSNAAIVAQGQALTVVKGAVTKVLSAASISALGQVIAIVLGGGEAAAELLSKIWLFRRMSSKRNTRR